MRKLIVLIFFLQITIEQFNAQTYSEFKWTKYYESVENKVVGIWPHRTRYDNLLRMKDLRYRWGYNNILMARYLRMDEYNLVIEAGFDPNKILRQLHVDTYEADVNTLPEMWGYYIDEPADEGQNLTLWSSINDWIKNKYPNSKLVISGYKRNDQLKDFVNSIGDKVLFSSYKHWWEFLGIWVSIPEDPDQRPDWSDMKNLFGSKFSMSWIGAHEDQAEYYDLLGKAKNLGLDGVFLYQLEPPEQEVGEDNLEQFSDAASKWGFLSKHFQQVIDFYENGNFVQRKFVGPSYADAVPSEFDHSELTFEQYIVTNDRIEDFYANIRITAGGTDNFIVPQGKSASFSSGNEIILKPGFHAQNGSDFKASIYSN